MAILQGVENPLDIKKLNVDELELLSDEIREQIIQTVSKNGGHLSSNLGMVESTVSLYKVFDFPKDKLIFDVGHQCYAHKILSGRKKEFTSIRLDEGLSGFPDINESEYDCFSAGHAGTSISAGLGYCLARDKQKQDYTVICVVGDGSIANGLNLEALCSSVSKPKNFIVILNDNGMSISKNKNGFYRMLSKSTTKASYIQSKKILLKIFGTSFITNALASFRNFIKRILNKNNAFENYGFKYVGIVDGNNIKQLTKILERVKNVAKNKAVLLHVKTKKGKGLQQAEEKSDIYHGVSANLKCETGSFSLALGNKLNSVIEKDKSVIAITAGMKDGTGLSLVEKAHSQNFIDVGIAEEYAVTLSSGMAMGGLKPFVVIYSTFLQRAYDQILHDVCLQNLPVVFCLDRAGLVGQDGKTHQGIFDISYLSHIPNLKILAPNTVFELEDAIDYALDLKCPVAIRYPKNATETDYNISLNEQLWVCLKSSKKVNLLAVGPNMLSLAIECANELDDVGVVSVRSIKPLCETTLMQIKDSAIIVLEENTIIGGVGSLISDFYLAHNISAKLSLMGVDDIFVEHGTIKNQLQKVGLGKENIVKEISKSLD